MEKALYKFALWAQTLELTESIIYKKLAQTCKDEKNKKVLLEISKQEEGHSNYWQTQTGKIVKPQKFKILWRIFSAKLLGLTFVLKKMELNEGTGSKVYGKLVQDFPETKRIMEDEAKHEKALLAMLEEERLQYVGSIVLGLNDALVELTGSLAGFSLALSSTKVIALVGLVTGISAAFSMAASDYLSSKAEGDSKASRSALYTGVAYLITVILLIMPYLLLADRFICLAVTLITAIIIIFLFNYYISVAKDLNFKKRFFEMSFISLGVAAFSFLVGFVLKSILGVNV